MYCMKCGKETTDSQVFCDACLVIMDKYPVKPGTHIQLHPRPEVKPGRSSSRKRSYTPEEQILRLRRGIKGLALALLSCLLALALTVTLLVHTSQQYRESNAIGKNYNTVEADGT